LGTQSLDPAEISRATGLPCSKVFTEACGSQIDAAAGVLKAGETVVACAQQAALFQDLAAEIDVAAPACFDLRDRAGWSDEGAAVGPKMAALAAEALLPRPAAKTLDILSQGTCLVLGRGEAAFDAAAALSETLAVTLLLDAPVGHAPVTAFDVICGRVSRASGTFGQFDLRIDDFQQMGAAGRGTAPWSAPRDGAQSTCDVIVDLSGNTPLFPAPEKRDGYLRTDPGSQPAVAKVLREASHLTGTFEKPLYVQLETARCAHSRAGQPACSKCLDLCPTGAITSAGDHVAIDPLICAGCGACAAACPSEAITYDAPPVATVFARLAKLAQTYRAAGGGTPRLLVHDETFGTEMISLGARFGRGLPADVIPLDVTALSGFGHAEMLGALGAGFGSVAVLLSPAADRAVLESEAALSRALSGGRAIDLLDLQDPDALSAALYDAPKPAAASDPMLPMGSRRQITRLAARTLNPGGETLPLPQGAPYGAVLVDQNACTLCLSCASLCPAGALGDNPDAPQLRFQEDACLQCGLCVNVCPEDAITLQPQMDLTDAALTQRVLHEEEPFACIECGVLFGVKSTIERITEKLAGNHAMFSRPETIAMIQMCDNCRIQAQFHATDNPLAAGERPRVRTTDDYLSKRKDH
jgi:ferredoxin